MLVPALGGNLLLVPLFGLKGIGYSAILMGLFLVRLSSGLRKVFPAGEILEHSPIRRESSAPKGRTAPPPCGGGWVGGA